jgi:hypothetical protein
MPQFIVDPAAEIGVSLSAQLKVLSVSTGSAAEVNHG